MQEITGLIKKYFFHLILLVIFMIYLLSADLLFDQVITVRGESPLVTMDLPDASEGIRYTIENMYDNKIEWKEMMTITGWAFLENQNNENCSLFLVFSGNNSRYIFKTTPILRSDVIKFFSNTSEHNLNLENPGFEANIPRFYLENGIYTMGILIRNQTARTYIITDNYCMNGNCSFSDYFSKTEESRIVEKNLPDSSDTIHYNFDSFTTSKTGSGEILTVSGWGFIEGQNTGNTSTYLVFDSSGARYVFTTRLIKRPDVSEFFNKTAGSILHLENSGFEAYIPKDLIGNNRYQLGIFIENQTAPTYIITNSYCTNGNCSFSHYFSKTEESRIVEKNLPNSSGTIHYNFDAFSTRKTGSDEILTVTGWGFVEGQDTGNTSTYLVFDSSGARYVFTTRLIKRPDVSEFFNKTAGSGIHLENSGFEAYIPKDLIGNNRYQLGIFIENQTAQTYNITNSYCTNGTCSI